MTQHTAPAYTYVLWLFREEAPIFILAVIGTGVALVQRRNWFAVFAGVWAFVLLVIYSVIPYKTPWVLLNMIVPMSIAGGAGVQGLRDYFAEHHGGKAAQLVPAALALAALAICFYQSVQLNFFHYDDDGLRLSIRPNPPRLPEYGCADQPARCYPGGNQTHVAVLTPDYWPLPWYSARLQKRILFRQSDSDRFPDRRRIAFTDHRAAESARRTLSAGGLVSFEARG